MMTQEQWIIALSILAVVGTMLAIAWFSFGVWYTQNRGPGRAKTRWRIYNRIHRKWQARQMAKLNPPTPLVIDDMSFNMAMDYDARARRRRKHGQSNS